MVLSWRSYLPGLQVFAVEPIACVNRTGYTDSNDSWSTATVHLVAVHFQLSLLLLDMGKHAVEGQVAYPKPSVHRHSIFV